ncbi:heterokaryon incompatibility protein-domain-containing protein [Xylaria arbuscula]|nr:heterokaryon incompatibility protein-domain-containing protein [Xylaria arbuscula]
MWLLNSCTWEMKEFISHKQAPPYAILSHTWGDEEVSFRDWQREPVDDVGRKEGFTKIKYCCQQAASDGLEWIWVDTCCIDKRSSAELSEAINSMFQWYEAATICYAYLYDVSNDSEVDLAKTRWVTRGWTLQELIAPREVVFYSSTWQALGTRSEFSCQLATVTGIDENFLTGEKSVDKASIAQRMSWAAKRTTSREEDIAYCLLGIFNVNMPLIYGEGPKAFRRLQEVLVREYPYDHSLFAWGKVVERVSNAVNPEVYDIWQTSGTKEIKHEPDKVVDRLLGLFAESPNDFEHSGRIVIAPTATKYFHYELKAPSVSSLVGRTAHVELPMFDIGQCIYSHIKYPSISKSSHGL